MKEVWKKIEGFDNYEVSNFGSVRNIKKKIIMKQKICHEYMYVGLTKNNKQTRFLVHVLVANAFVPNLCEGDRVRHIDGNKSNNTYSNLTWYKRLVHGFGVLDVSGCFSKGNVIDVSYNYWVRMIRRCYVQTEKKWEFYKDCKVCEEWRYFSNFREWFYNSDNGYKEGYDLDKDILSSNCNVYSPETCCFVPHEINNLIICRKRKSDGLPNGVCYDKYRKMYIGVGLKQRVKRFRTMEEARDFYVKTKKEYIVMVANKYFKEGKITHKIYNSLLNYKVV